LGQGGIIPLPYFIESIGGYKMPRIKKNTNTPVEVVPQTTEAYSPELEVLDGDAIQADIVEEKILDDTVCVCYNGVQALEVETPYGNFRVNSNSENLRGQERGILPNKGTYGITKNVPRKAWEYFAEKFKDWGEIKSGLLFATTIDKVRSEVAMHKGTVNGFEPLTFENKETK